MLFFHAMIALLSAALILSCPPPFNDFRFLGNDTHNSSELVEAALLQQGLGWTDMASPGGLGNPWTPWPRNGDGIAVVTICFWNTATVDALGQLVFDALYLWEAKLGQPSAKTQHGVKFDIRFRDDEPVLCKDANGEWESVHPPTSLVVLADNGLRTPAWASVGWSPLNAEGLIQNQMRVNPLLYGVVDREKGSIAHEIGHVLGLSHEYQRDDRDDYLSYKCENVEGYADAKARAEPDGVSMDEVSKSDKLCIKYDFLSGRMFVADMWSSDTQAPKLVRKGPFDVKSIVIYDSSTGLADGNNSKNVMDVPLIKWKTPGFGIHPEGQKAEKSEIFEGWGKVTDLDIAGVKAIYP